MMINMYACKQGIHISEDQEKTSLDAQSKTSKWMNEMEQQLRIMLAKA